MDFAQNRKILTGNTCDCVTKYINITAILHYFRKIKLRFRSTLFKKNQITDNPYNIITARKQSLGQGNVFTPVFLFTGALHPD